MARKRTPPLKLFGDDESESDRAAAAAARRLRSVKMIQPLRRLLKQIHRAGCQRDRASNRRFFYNHYLSLLLLYFVNPSLASLRALQNASNWERQPADRDSHRLEAHEEDFRDDPVLFARLDQRRRIRSPSGATRQVETIQTLSPSRSCFAPPWPLTLRAHQGGDACGHTPAPYHAPREFCQNASPNPVSNKIALFKVESNELAFRAMRGKLVDINPGSRILHLADCKLRRLFFLVCS